ncbi:MAG: hypothetical protein GC201_05790 [Alphaproteobacteria bacterium]|nr:hypothetical protein [Alphaproteobacteria bacterium]
MTSEPKRHSLPHFRITAVLFTGLLVALVALWLARIPLAEWAIENQIDKLGLGPAEVEVTHLGLNGIDLRLVRSAAGSIGHVSARYNVADLLTGHIDYARIEHSRLDFALRGGKLTPAIRSGGGAIVLPTRRLEIEDSRLTMDLEGRPVVAEVSGVLLGEEGITADFALTLQAPKARLSGRVAGAMSPDGSVNGSFAVSSGDVTVGGVTANGLSGAFRVTRDSKGSQSIDGSIGFQQIASGGTPLGSGRLTTSLVQPGNVLNLTLDSAPLNFSLRADGGRPAKGVPFAVDGKASASFIGSLSGATKEADGSLAFDASGTTPPVASLDGVGALGLGDWLRQGTAKATLSGSVKDFEVPGAFSVDEAKVSLALGLASGSLRITAPHAVSLAGLELGADLVDPGSLLAGRATLTAEPVSGDRLLAIEPAGQSHRLTTASRVAFDSSSLSLKGTWSIEAGLQAEHWSASAPATPATGPLTVKADLAVDQPDGPSLPSAKVLLRGSYDTDATHVRLTADEGRLALKDARLSQNLSLPESARLELHPGATVSEDRKTGDIAIDGGLRPFKWTLKMASDTGEPRTMVIGARSVTYHADGTGKQVELTKGSVSLPSDQITADGISAEYNADAAGGVLRASVADVHSTDEPALFPPLHSRLLARLTGDKVKFRAGLEGGGETILVSAEGRHDLATGSGGATFALKPIDLARADAIKQLSPLLASTVTSGSGMVSAGGALHWGEGAPPGTLSLDLKNVGLKGDSFTLSSLNGHVRLDSLAPPATLASQHVTAVVQLSGLPQMPLDVTFRLEPGQLVLEHASAEIFGGRFETTNAVFDATSGDGAMNLQISDMNLETALAVLDLAQLKGTGRLGGLLPLRIRDGRVAIDAGKLESGTSGVVQVDVGALSDQLKSAGKNVDLAFRALKDFHYERMTITAQKPFSGNGKALFHLEGNNPAVMDAQPFVFNITLETDFDYLTQLLTQLSGVANKALGWGVKELKGP